MKLKNSAFKSGSDKQSAATGVVMPVAATKRTSQAQAAAAGAQRLEEEGIFG
jgi:co-chaperonin GroES (HSP10)